MKFYKMLCVLTAAVFCMTAPAVVQAAQNEKQTEAAQEEEIEDREIAQELAGMKYDHSLELQYADQFAVDYYEGGYALITIAGDERFLLVPEDKEAPEGLDADISVIQKPSAEYLSGCNLGDGSFLCSGRAGQYQSLRYKCRWLVY